MIYASKTTVVPLERDKGMKQLLKAFWANLKSFHNDESGLMSATGLLMMGIAMIFIAVGFIVYPIVITGTDAILAYEYSSNTSITDATYTGLTAVTGIVPLLILLGFVTAGVVTGFMGYKLTKSGASSRLNPTSLLMLGIGVIFIAVGLIIFPVVLDGVSSVLHGGGAGISLSYTGLSAVVGVTPLLVLIAFTSAAVISGFFGVKNITR